jgi:hypothetical protein
MKRLLLITVFLVVMVPGAAGAAAGYADYILTLTGVTTVGYYPISGNTTVAGGVSQMQVWGVGLEPANRTSGTVSTTPVLLPHLPLYGLDAVVVQLRAVELCAAAQQRKNPNANVSGVTFVLAYRESLLSGSSYYSSAVSTTVLSTTFLSATSPRQVTIYPTGVGYLWFEFQSGATPFDRAEFLLRVLK